MKTFSAAVWALGVLVAFATVRPLLRGMANGEEGEEASNSPSPLNWTTPLGNIAIWWKPVLIKPVLGFVLAALLLIVAVGFSVAEAAETGKYIPEQEVRCSHKGLDGGGIEHVTVSCHVKVTVQFDDGSYRRTFFVNVISMFEKNGNPTHVAAVAKGSRSDSVEFRLRKTKNLTIAYHENTEAYGSCINVVPDGPEKYWRYKLKTKVCLQGVSDGMYATILIAPNRTGEVEGLVGTLLFESSSDLRPILLQQLNGWGDE